MVRGIVAHLIGLLLIASATHCIAEDWPRWRGPRGDGTWKGPRLPVRWPDAGLKEVWRQPIGGGYAGPSVTDGRLTIMDRQTDPAEVERVLAFDAATGKPLWEHAYAVAYRKLDYGNGPRATPTHADGRLFTLGAVGHLHCLDAATGRVLWSHDLVAEFGAVIPEWGLAASPVIWRDLVIVHPGAAPGGAFLAFDAQTGRHVWRSGDDPAGYCTPIVIQIDGREQLVGWTPEHVLGIEPATGEVQWSLPYEVTYGVSIATPVFHRGVAFVSSYWEGSKAIRLGPAATDAQLIWEDQTDLQGLMSQPLCREGYAYCLDKDRGLVCFEVETGRQLWTDAHEMTPRGRNPHAALAWLGDGDRAIILNSEGDLILARLNSDGYHEQSRVNIIRPNPGPIWAHPALAGNRIFARNDDELVCVELPTVVAGEEQLLQAEVISIGDELTSGQRLDTNSQWLSERLGELGIRVMYHTTVADDLAANVRVFRQAVERVDVVVATGGLGPTADDLTRQALAEAAGVPLALDEPSLEHIKGLFARRQRPMPESNIVQAMFPVGGRPIPNPQGSAPGIDMRIAKAGGGECRILAVPGVPAEMREMWQATLAGELAAIAGGRMIRHHRIKCFGAGESDLEQMLPDIIRRGRVPSVGITVSGATITLRITAEGSTPEECLAAMGPTRQTIQQCLGTLVFGEEDDELEHAVGRLLAAQGRTLATAEWGTGGLIAHRLVEAREARPSYLGGFVTVSAVALAGFTDMSAEAVAQHGPVSGEAAHAMAVACRRQTGADFGLAVSEFPEHDPAAQQPHPVYYALASSRGVIVKSSPFTGHSAILKTLSAKRALNLLRLELLREAPGGEGGPHRAPTL